MTSDWIDNEVTIDYNAAFVGACAGLYEFFGTEDMAPTKNFPPDPKFIAGEGGGNNYWINACGIDDLNADGSVKYNKSASKKVAAVGPTALKF